jgi:hypothetical protein
MSRWRSHLRRLERDVAGDEIIILQKDGSVARFPESARAEAFSHEADRMRKIYRGEDPGEGHPFTRAQRNAMYPDSYAKHALDADKQLYGMGPDG